MAVMYGMTYQGGSNNDGVIFSVPTTGGTPTILFNFDSTNGAYPLGSLILSAPVSTITLLPFLD